MTPDATAPRSGTVDAVVVDRVSKLFGTGTGAVLALDDVSLTIAQGEFFTLLGPSGCGKTTLLRVLAGFEPATAGRVLLDGRDVSADPPNRRPINTVFQSYALFPHRTVAGNVAFGLERQGLRGAAVRTRVEAMLRLVRLEDLATRRPQHLSGGQQQRVALARALAPQPRLLLLDEPLSALDLKLRRGMQDELKRIQRQTAITFVLVTHDQEEALSMSDRLAVMDRGRVLQVGSPHEVYERPTCRFVADFVGEANVLPGELVGLASPHVAVRPERVRVVAAGRAPEPDGPSLPGTVRSITYGGARTRCVVALADGRSIHALPSELPADIGVGEAVACVLPDRHLLPLAD